GSGGEDVGYGDAEAGQQQRRSQLTGAELPVNIVHLPAEREHQNPLLQGIDDPVLRNSRASVLMAFRDQIAFPILRIRADDFHHQVRTVPVLLMAAVRVLDLHEQDVRLAVLPRPEADGTRSEKHLSETARLDE